MIKNLNLGYSKKSCRLCKSKNLKKFLDLGLQPPSDQFVKKNYLDDFKAYYPLEVNNCMKCGFKQLSYVVNKTILYQEDYPYESSLTKAGEKHFYEFAESVIKKYKFKKKDLVLDIGSNVGVLLNNFKKLKLNILGVDPAKNICKIANNRGIKTLNSFFNKKITNKILKQFGCPQIITGTNVFAHIDDLDEFFKNINKIIDKKKGILIIEVPHFLNLFKNLEYDTIYHEHLSYITVKPLIKYLKNFNLEIIDIIKRDIHGGSIRIFISKKYNYEIDKSVNIFIRKEKNAKINNLKILNNFSKKVKENRFKLINYLSKLKLQNKKVVALSTPAKGMTLLNYCKIDNDYLSFATDKSKLKINKFTPGGQIKVFSDKEIILKRPDYAILLAWNFAKEIIRNNKDFIKRGGKLIIPIPKLKVISKKKLNEY